MMYYNPYLQPQYEPMQQYRQPQYMQQNVPVSPQSAIQPVLNQQDERIWVQGENSAQAYLVAPNSFVRLWDSTRPVFYEKRADATGKPVLTVFEYCQKNAGDEISKDNVKEVKDYDERIRCLESQIRALQERVNNYDTNESNSDDAGVYEVQEDIPRRSTRRSAKTGSAR